MEKIKLAPEAVTTNSYIDSIGRHIFYDSVKKQNIDLSKASAKKKEYNEHYHKFNVLAFKLKEEEDIRLFEIAKYLWEDYFDNIQEVLNCFDENNMWALREEAAVTYNKGSIKNILDSFLYL
jgi:hypothetical protein